MAVVGGGRRGESQRRNHAENRHAKGVHLRAVGRFHRILDRFLGRWPNVRCLQSAANPA